MLQQQALIQLGCQQVMHALLAAIDHRQIEKAVSYFIEGGSVFREGKEISGHAAISQMLSSRAPEIVTRHRCSNFLTTKMDNLSVSAECYLLIFSGTKDDSESVSWNPPKCVDYKLEFVKPDENWLIESIKIKPSA